MVKIAFDIGGVIFTDGDFEIADESMKSVLLMTQKYGRHNIYILSKAGPKYQDLIMEKLLIADFFHVTGLPIENVHFVLEYEEKQIVCSRLGINFLIDDHIKIVRYIITAPQCSTIPIWFGKRNNTNITVLKNSLTESISSNNAHLQQRIKQVCPCHSWKHLRKIFQKVKQERIL